MVSDFTKKLVFTFVIVLCAGVGSRFVSRIGGFCELVAMGGGSVSPGRRDEVVLITGCSDGGIGAELALEFCNCGFTVVATSRSLSTMAGLEGHPHIQLLPLDLLSEKSIKEAVATVMAMYGRVDILVNNAAMPCTAPLAEVPIALVDKVYRTNYLGILARQNPPLKVMPFQGICGCFDQ